METLTFYVNTPKTNKNSYVNSFNSAGLARWGTAPAPLRQGKHITLPYQRVLSNCLHFTRYLSCQSFLFAIVQVFEVLDKGGVPHKLYKLTIIILHHSKCQI